MKGKEAKKKAIDESVRVEISSDRMLGVISFTKPENGGKELTLAEVKKSIKAARIVSGINEDLLEQLMEERQYGHKYPIAHGKPPVHGEDGTLELFFDIKCEHVAALRPKEKEDGSVDFKDLDLIQTIAKDQKLAKITHPTEGVPGKNVLGKEIRAKKGKIKRLPRGKNVYVSEDELTLHASIEGQLIYEFDQVNISETYIVDGDAGVATGNIDFSGNVLVRGNVESGFTIKAGGDIEVQGFVGEATIIAGRDILLRHGIQGKNKGMLVAEGDIVTKFIQNSIVRAKGNLYTEAIMHSQVEAGDSVIVEVNKGLIVGGTVQATNLISAKIIGSPMSTVTEIKICMALALQHQYNAAKENLAKQKVQLDQVGKNVAFIHDKLAKGERLPKARLDSVKKMLQLQKQLQTQIKATQEEYDSLKATLQDYQAGAIQVSDIMYPGCKITMGSCVKHIREDLNYSKICIKDREIKIEAFN